MHSHPRRIGLLLPIAIVVAVVVALHVVGAISLLTGGFGVLVLRQPIFDLAIGLLSIVALFHGLEFWRSRAK
jgi:hypothetical protein